MGGEFPCFGLAIEEVGVPGWSAESGRFGALIGQNGAFSGCGVIRVAGYAGNLWLGIALEAKIKIRGQDFLSSAEFPC